MSREERRNEHQPIPLIMPDNFQAMPESEIIFSRPSEDYVLALEEAIAAKNPDEVESLLTKPVIEDLLITRRLDIIKNTIAILATRLQANNFSQWKIKDQFQRLHNDAGVDSLILATDADADYHLQQDKAAKAKARWILEHETNEDNVLSRINATNLLGSLLHREGNAKEAQQHNIQAAKYIRTHGDISNPNMYHRLLKVEHGIIVQAADTRVQENMISRLESIENFRHTLGDERLALRARQDRALLLMRRQKFDEGVTLLEGLVEKYESLGYDSAARTVERLEAAAKRKAHDHSKVRYMFAAPSTL